MTQARPFSVGDLVRPSALHGWTYTGLAGKPDDPAALRRYRKGEWVLELRARANVSLQTRVVSIRTTAEDDMWWAAERRRRSADR